MSCGAMDSLSDLLVELILLLSLAILLAEGQNSTSTVPPWTVHARQSGPLVHFSQADGVHVGGDSVQRVTI